MSKNLRFTQLAVLCIIIAAAWINLASPVQQNADAASISANQSNNQLPTKKSSEVSEFITDAVISDIRQREYHITFDKDQQVYKAPNRAHGIRTSFSAGQYNIKSRKKDDQQWELKLSTLNVMADAVDLVKPTSTATTTTDQQLDFAFTDYTEQYINNNEGVRQNFIIFKKAAQLQVQLKVEGMQADQLNDSLILLATQDHQFTYSGLRAWDANKKELPATLQLHNNTITLSVHAQDAVFPVTIDPIIAAGTPANANRLLEANQAAAAFGCSVSGAGDLNGDGYGDVIAGARSYDAGQTDEGVVFVYYGSATGIGTTATMLEQNNAGSQFGYSVSFAGDVNADGFGDIIIGAPLYITSGSNNPGAAFIYHGSATGIATTPAITLTGPANGSQFGFSVSNAGDVNGDGFSDVVVGAPLHSPVLSNEGSIFIYHGSATGIPAFATTNFRSTFSGARFGSSVANAGDVNGDGYSDIVVGAPRYTNGHTSEGTFMVYRGSAAGINTTAHIRVEANVVNGLMGTSVAGAGDMNGDGLTDIVVGCPGMNNGGGQTNEGLVRVFFGAATMSTTASFTYEPNVTNYRMGTSVASAGDVNGDGFSDVVFGAPGFNSGQTAEGGAYVFHGGPTLSNIPASTIQANQNNAIMGESVRGVGDVNGDGFSDIMVGAASYNNGQATEGIALVYHGSLSGITVNTYSARPVGSIDESYLGISVASAGDINGDGYSDVIAGADFYSNGQTDEGAVYVYYGSATGPGAPTILQSNRNNTQLGYSVSSAGDVNGDGYSDIIAGAYVYNNGNTGEGAAYIWLGSATGINTASLRIVESNQNNANFGYSVSTAGDVNGDGYSDVIIGAPNYDNPQTNEGAAFIYHGSATGISTTAATVLEVNQNNANFGYSVAGAGDINGDGYSDIVVGAPGYDNTENNGGAFVYRGAAAGINAATRIEIQSNRDDTRLGSAVAGAGDVNGDGFSDIIIGANEYENGQDIEGRVQVHLGSATGITVAPVFTYDSNTDDGQLGYSVAGIGDINGDGYADIAAGSPRHDNSEGAFWVWTGSSTGINATPLAYNATNRQLMGWSVAGAGDINGDGVGDFLVGVPDIDNGGNNAGGFQIHYGSSLNATGHRRSIRLYNTGTTTPINRANITDSKFATGLFSRSFDGRTKGKLVWETKGSGIAFSTGTDLANSVQQTGSQTTYTNLGTSGTELRYDVNKVATRTKVRARVGYDPVTSITGQLFSPWTYPQDIIGARDMGGSPLPVTLHAFTATAINNSKVLIKWQTGSEINSDHFVVERSADRSHWEDISKVAAAGNSNNVQQYQSTDNQPYKGVSYYRLRQVDKDGSTELSVIRKVNIEAGISFSAYPNPVRTMLIVNASATQLKELRIFSQSGQQVTSLITISISGNTATIDMHRLTPGTYFLRAGTKSGTVIKY